MVFGLFGSVAYELHFCVCAGYRLLICYGPLPVFFFTASKLQFRHRVEGLRTHRFWLARARLVVAFCLFGSVASSFGTMWKGCERTVFGLPFFWLVFCMPWARILLLFEAFGSLKPPPRHSALRYTGFGPSLAARVPATRHVLWIPKVTGSIFAGLCFACLGHEACCRSRLSEASQRLLHGIRRCGILVSDPASQRGCRPKEMFYGFQR